MAATKMFFHHMVLIFHSFKGFSYLDLEMQVFQIWKISRFLIRWFSSSTWIYFSDLGLIYMFFRSRSNFARPMGSLLGSLPDDFKEVFQTTSKKS
ncbi:hypothetical protein F2Q69_00054026 [Brassica cretica]|uniref:Uncharacterized protein n=1 Tax=Brassica cretica TaxID=69181 RepID=A0A8S9MNF2_BRACR|nr:hypothetical protein F2Q69_00054026 [Brassica cretica]